MTIHTSLYEWCDGRNFSCYAWENDSDIRWYIINVANAKRLHPNLSTVNAVKNTARDMFALNLPSSKNNPDYGYRSLRKSL